MYLFSRNLRFTRVAQAVVLALIFHSVAAEAETAPLLTWSVDDRPSTVAPTPTIRQDPAVLPAEFNTSDAKSLVQQSADLSQAAPASADARRLAPPSNQAVILEGQVPVGRESLSLALPRIESLGTAGAGLAIVVGLFLLCALLMRRSGPKPTSPLPKEAVAVLGRVPLAASHFAHLLQFGNKLVLVSVGPDSVTSLSEVTDPNEVNRLLGLCTRNHKQSTTAEFHQVLEELASEPARGFLDDQARPAGAVRRGRA